MKATTGNYKPCPYFNEQDIAILRILGETPSFKGIRPARFDMPIVVTKSSSVSTKDAARCNAKVVGSTSSIEDAINSGTLHPNLLLNHNFV